MNETALKLIFTGVILVLVFMGKNENYATLAPSESLTFTARLGKIAGDTEQKLPASLIETSPIVLKIPEAPIRDVNPIQTREAPKALPPTEDAPKLVQNIISADSPIFLVSNLKQSDNIAELSADKHWPIASITKLMTAVIASEYLPKENYITLGADAVSTEGPKFKEGDVLRAGNLIAALLTVSSNDAALALAHSYGFTKFIATMNETAKRLGMQNTYFKEPTGLSSLNQSTANDLKLLARYIYDKYPDIFAITREKEIKTENVYSHETRSFTNINLFAGRQDFFGGKTGYIQDSGENLLSIFMRNGEPIILIVMGAGDRFKETETLLRQFDKIYRH